jgi:four helix bundle protein
MGSIRSYRDLIVWQKAMDLVVEIYRLTDRFPRTEQYGLVSQMTRAAVSVPANIAEGSGRGGSRREYEHFLGIARGSLMEVETLLELATRLHYLNGNDAASAAALIDEVSRMLSSLRSRLGRN